MCTSSSGHCPRREDCRVTTVESQPFTDAALCHIDLFSIVSDRIPSNHKKMRSSNTSLLDQTTRHTDLPVSSSNTRIPKDQKSTLKLWPLLRMISGATYSGVPQKVQVFWPHRIFLAKPKSTWKAKVDPFIRKIVLKMSPKKSKMSSGVLVWCILPHPALDSQASGLGTGPPSDGGTQTLQWHSQHRT